MLDQRAGWGHTTVTWIAPGTAAVEPLLQTKCRARSTAPLDRDRLQRILTIRVRRDFTSTNTTVSIAGHQIQFSHGTKEAAPNAMAVL